MRKPAVEGKAVLGVMRRRKRAWHIGEVAERLGETPERVRATLRRLREKGAVRMSGVRGGAVWEVVGQAATPETPVSPPAQTEPTGSAP